MNKCSERDDSDEPSRTLWCAEAIAYVEGYRGMDRPTHPPHTLTHQHSITRLSTPVQSDAALRAALDRLRDRSMPRWAGFFALFEHARELGLATLAPERREYSELGPQGPEGPQGSPGPQGPPGVSGGGIRWVDATNTVIEGLHGPLSAPVLTYIDGTGIVWSANMSPTGWQVGTLSVGLTAYTVATTRRVWTSSNCSGPAYYTLLWSRPARVAHKVEFHDEYRALHDNAAAPIQLVTYWTQDDDPTCYQGSGSTYAIVETDTVVVTPPTISAALPVHPEVVQ